MNDALMIVSALLVVMVAALGAVAVVAVAALSRDRAPMARSIKDVIDRMLVREDEHLERMKMEKEVELGSEYMATQRQIESLRAKNKNLNGTITRSAPDIHVPMDEDRES